MKLLLVMHSSILICAYLKECSLGTRFDDVNIRAPARPGISRDVRDCKQRIIRWKREAFFEICARLYQILRENHRGEMAQVDENWQTKCSSISQRTEFVFNKELLSDVKFVVPVSNGESETKVIPAHKFVLAISSPVFYAMFYGQMADTTDSIELPDCEYESLLELFRYMYSDEVKVTGSNVMRVLYLAKKYMMPSLADKCAEYLRDNLEASNVFSILPHTQKFEDKDLEDRCWEVIEMQTEEAVTSDEFVMLERSLVEAVVKRDKLNVKEVELFKAVDRWAIKECERQEITPDGEAKRRFIGEEIVKEIRFPLMSQKEFVSVVFDAKVLDFQEIGDVMKHLNDVHLTAPLPFIQKPRMGSLHRCYRFQKLNPPALSSWEYSRSLLDGIGFTVSKSIKLHGGQHFGSEEGKYKVSIEVRDVANCLSLAKQSGSYTSEKDEVHGYYGFDVLFKPPVHLNEGKIYEIVSVINGPNSWYGEEGQRSVKCQGVEFTFSDPGSKDNGTNQTIGQFPALLFSRS